MSHSEPKELIRAKQLVNEGKHEEALELMKNFEEKGGHTLHDIVSCHLLKCDLLFQQGLYENVVKLAEQTYRESLGLGKNLLTVDALLLMAETLSFPYGNALYSLDKAFDIVKQGEELLKTLTQESPTDHMQREAYIAFIKGNIYYWKIEVDLSIRYFKRSLELGEKTDLKRIIALSLRILAWNYGYHKGDLDHGLEYAKQGVTIAKDSKNKFTIAQCLLNLGVLYEYKGEIDRCIISYKRCLVIYKELNNKERVATVLNNMADAYRMIGELDHALECSEQSLAEISKLGNLWTVAYFHDFLIQILIEKGDLMRAQQYFSHLEQLNNQLKDKNINLSYLYNKALLLKESPRISNRGKAEEILKQILEEKDIFWELKERVLLTLGELLIIEFQMSNEVEVLDELKSYVTQLLETAEKSKSYWILCETYLLQARLALITLDMIKARQFLTKSQEIADKHGLNRLAIKISNEHDELLKKLDMWEKLKDSKASLSERMELARLNEQMEKMIRKREIVVPELADEEPIVILIISEGGRPVFSESFVEEWSFEDHLFGGFLTAINSFSDQMFSEGLNRANFGEYTIIMNSLHPFLVCYLFKGQSYLAQQRVTKFIDKIKEDINIWKTLNEYNQTYRMVQLEDIPSLEPLITKIFIDKTDPLLV